MNVKWKNEEKVIMKANCLLATRHNGDALKGCSVRNKMLVERNNRSFPNCTTPYGVECGGGNALFYQNLNPDGFGAGFCKSPVAEARNEYTYSASGQKLKVVQKWNPSFSTAPVIGSAINTAALTQSKTTDYIGDMIYENGALKRILIDGGYVEGGVYHYFLTDHLGNNRLVVNSSGTVVQKNHYYPFGTAFAETAVAEQGKQPYKFGNKELDQMSGLNWYDFSARFKDDFWFRTPDPLAEKYPWISPYVYCNNNPLRYIDPTGMDFTNAAWEEVNRLIADINARQTKNAQDIAKKQAQIDAGGLSDKKIASLRKDINKLSSNSTELEGVRGEIATLAGSDQMYDIKRDNSMNTSTLYGSGEYRSSAAFNFGNGNFDIKLGDSSLGTLAHELKHAYQFETGAYSTGYMSNGTPFYDQSDEVEAYARGAFFRGESRSASSIASDSYYGKLQAGPMDATNLSAIILSNPVALQKLANRTRSAFRINGVTYRMP